MSRIILAACLLLAALVQPAQAWQKQTTLSASGTGTNSNIIPLDLTLSRCGVSFIVTLSSGASLTATVEVTGDDIQIGSGDKYRVGPDYNAATGHWNSHDTLVALTASANGNLMFPATGARLNVTSYSSGSVTLAAVMNDKCTP